MGKTLKFFGRFFVFAIAITIFSLVVFRFSSEPVYAEESFFFTNDLDLGAAGKDVEELQILLNSKGYNIGIPDGKFGPMTKEQVMICQKNNGLAPDGIVGKKVRALLNETSTIIPTSEVDTKIEIKNNSALNKTNVAAETKTRTEKANINTSKSSISLDRILRLVKPIMSGDDVKALQIFLKSKSYDVGIPDGFFGPKTHSAVIFFQKANGLNSDGLVGPNTRIFINNNISPVGSEPIATLSNYKQIAGCSSAVGFSVATGVSCSTGLPKIPVIKITGGGSSGQSIYTISNPTINGVTIPEQAQTPVAALSDTREYSATISWNSYPSVFIASTSYTAIITITPKANYTLNGVRANYFTVAGATSTNEKDSGVIVAVFPATPLKQLTISTPIITASKAYDGNTNASITTGTLSGIIGIEDVNVSATASYDNKNSGTGKTITILYTLGGVNANNYIKPADYIVTSGVITSIPLTILNPTLATSKEYDRTTTAAVTAGSLVGVVDGGVSASASASYDSVNIGTNKTITTTYSLSGANAGNYIKPTDYVVYSGIIITKQLTISTPNLTLSKLYDKNTAAVVTTGALFGVASGEDVSVATAIATYDTANVGISKTITVSFTLTGASMANYVKPVNYTTSSGVINAVQLSVSVPNLTTTKVYNSTTAAAVTAGSLSGVISGDTVTVSAVANYDNALPGTGKNITTVHTLGGAQQANYIKPVDYIVSTGVITPIVISTAAIAGVNAPVVGETPVTTLAGNTYYSATISWNGLPITFEPLTVYTATITLTAKTGYTFTGVSANFFIVAGAATTNFIDSGVVSAVFPATGAQPATAPISITLAAGSSNPVGGVTNVVIPPGESTDRTGVITGYVATTADKIKFTVIDGGSATSSISINGGAYTNGADYQIIPKSSLPTIVVTTSEASKFTITRTFVITGPILGQDGLTYGIVMGADGKKWLDRNLGATRVATALNDTSSYGNLYQWGRSHDGHQDTNSVTSSTLSATDKVVSPDTGKFILPTSNPYDWRSTQNNNLWQGVNGVNNVCPSEFRLPTKTEWVTLVNNASITNSATAYDSSLKLTVAGSRNHSTAVVNQGSLGNYWSSTISGTDANYLYLVGSAVYSSFNYFRASGYSVRCLKD